MFRGQVNVVCRGLSRSATWMLFLGAVLGCVVLVFVAKGLVVVPIGVAVLVWWGYWYRLQPPKWVEATADDGGIFIDGKPLVLRKDIKQAYIQPHQDAETITSGIQVRTFIELPDYPLTVEIIRRDGTVLNIDPSGEAAAAALLTALGFPVTTCPPD
jgi:hypothetical protein